MKILRIILPILVIGLAVFIGKWLVDNGPKPEGEEREVVAPIVEVVEVKVRPHRFSVESQGEVEPSIEIDLVPEVSGRVISVSDSLGAGGFFEEGDVLVSIDPTDLELELVRTRASLEQAKVRLVREEAEAEAALAEWRRLGKGTPGALLLREPQIREVKALIESAQASVSKVERDLERCRLKAPFAGRVTRKNVDVGQFVNRGAVIGRLYSVDAAEIRLPVSSPDLGLLDLPFDYQGESRSRELPKVEIRAEIGGIEHRWQGLIERTDGRVDSMTRMFHAVARIEDPYQRKGKGQQPPLAAGLFVQATIEGRKVEKVAVIPRIAVQENSFVWVVTRGKPNRLQRRDVTLLQKGQDDVVAGSGLEEGDLLCVSALNVMTEGMEVRLASDPEVARELENRRKGTLETAGVRRE